MKVTLAVSQAGAFANIIGTFTPTQNTELLVADAVEACAAAQEDFAAGERQ